MRTDNRWSAEEAQRILDEWTGSGESLAAFSRKRGYAAARLYWWRNRLANKNGLAEKPRLLLVPASVMTESAATVTIRLASGIGVEATGATPEWIAAVVGELTRSI